MAQLPKPIALLVIDYANEWILLKWIRDARVLHPDTIKPIKRSNYVLPDDVARVDWDRLAHCHSPAAIDLLEHNLDKIPWKYISYNKDAMHILRKHPDKIDWDMFAGNPHEDALAILFANPSTINWFFFSQNTNPRAIAYLAKHPEKIDWFALSANANAMTILSRNTPHIDWEILRENEGAYELRYEVFELLPYLTNCAL